VLAVLSDVHANREAFEAVLADCERLGAERIICLGDVVGYGPDPRACVRLARQRCAVTLQGNHDHAVVHQALGFNPVAREAIRWTRERLRPGLFAGLAARADWRFLERLPLRHEEGDLLFVHGSPRDPVAEYIQEEDLNDMGFGVGEKIKEIMDGVPGLCFAGHTHTPGVVSPDFTWLSPAELDDGWPRQRTPAVVNVGSVGQSRDGDTRACYVTVDESAVRFRRVAYDYEATVEKMAAIEELDERLARRLAAGR
jgi:diadenosine tetraphosphatase ApaH/serine/threonine PP2A family protein phosphatase